MDWVDAWSQLYTFLNKSPTLKNTMNHVLAQMEPGATYSRALNPSHELCDPPRQIYAQNIEGESQAHWTSTSCDHFEVITIRIVQESKSSTFDEDHLGNTLLHEVLVLYKRHQTCGVKSDEHISLIQFLLNSGVDPNVISIDNSTDWDNPAATIGTALDVFAPKMADLNTRISAKEEIRNTAIYKKLADNGCEFSQPLSSINQKHPYYQFEYFQEQVLQLRRFSEQIELNDHEHLISVILQRYERDLFHVVKQANINHASSVNGLTALHFAIE
ncbi:hypothetical protein G7Y89_g9601 [Cudoniella acicularis]|uniref:Uncharacterized protein n=1 Tax=Cudoniella acicularis TaxID=354080 RepID=A0A8H4RH03_9HELO|nr:hypothetical protein G7Y89_g9601 [Cudoniella acicularis]